MTVNIYRPAYSEALETLISLMKPCELGKKIEKEPEESVRYKYSNIKHYWESFQFKTKDMYQVH